ncbi:hypothetical protein IWZ03DRAFT_410040 [Phyllosticta citriasiana]|uniref:Uncharacterized protein n=1 Tax=Phyllosticta citriasiana TaxID=595635 RepID=A0ABR1K8D9_9PEZI
MKLRACLDFNSSLSTKAPRVLLTAGPDATPISSDDVSPEAKRDVDKEDGEKGEENSTEEERQGEDWMTGSEGEGEGEGEVEGLRSRGWAELRVCDVKDEGKAEGEREGEGEAEGEGGVKARNLGTLRGGDVKELDSIQRGQGGRFVSLNTAREALTARTTNAAHSLDNSRSLNGPDHERSSQPVQFIEGEGEGEVEVEHKDEGEAMNCRKGRQPVASAAVEPQDVSFWVRVEISMVFEAGSPHGRSSAL